MSQADLPDHMKIGLYATVHVPQEDGTVRVYGPGDTVPAADAKKITNPEAWGYKQPRTRGPTLDYGAPGEDWGDGLPTFLDITCDCQEDGQLVARFECCDYVGRGDDGVDLWEWRWTASLAMHRRGDSAGGATVAGKYVETSSVDEDRRAVVVLPDGRQAVRLRCRACGRDLPMTWTKAMQKFNRLRMAGVSSLSLRALIATMTK